LTTHVDPGPADFAVTLAGRRYDHAGDLLRRYCGLPWSSGAAETWAFRYYDLIPSGDPDTVDPLDVVATAALHPQISRADLAWFHDHRTELSYWLRDHPHNERLKTADDSAISDLAGLPGRFDAVPLVLLTKVLHRKRPQLIPLLDRHVIDAYRPITGQRAANPAWRPLLAAMRDDLADAENALLFVVHGQTLSAEAGHDVSDLRMLDITVWMSAHRDTPPERDRP
jgi:hypothetical protein